MYQHVMNRIPFEGLSVTTKECFGMYIPTPKFHEFKSILRNITGRHTTRFVDP